MHRYGHVIENAAIEMAKQIIISDDNKVDYFDKNELGREIVLCILSSQIKYENALLMNDKIFPRISRLVLNQVSNKNMLLDEIYTILKGNNHNQTCKGHRFPNLIFNRLDIFIKYYHKITDGIINYLFKEEESVKIRRYIVENVPGLGLKQSSMLLRDMGYDNKLAVLDRHILNYMYCVGLLDVCPRSIQSVCKYENFEEYFCLYAHAKSVCIKQLDVSIWSVMRNWKRMAKQ